MYEAIRRAVASGEQFRIADEVPLRLIVVDGELGLLPMVSAPDQAKAGALIVHESGLLDALLTLFESVWAQANRITVAADEISMISPGEIDDRDAQILGLLLAGLTDEAVATQLDTSLRTVQRRVRHLMDLAGVLTRLQLGWHAARHGWV